MPAMILPLDHSEPIRIRCIDYCSEEYRMHEIADVPEFLESHRPNWSRVRWIHVEGLADIDIVESLAEKYQLHPLALEDVLHTVERPKVEDYQASEGSLDGFSSSAVRLNFATAGWSASR